MVLCYKAVLQVASFLTFTRFNQPNIVKANSTLCLGILTNYENTN